MIIVKPVGGLASQLHKYAIGKALAIKHDTTLKLDLSWFVHRPEEDTPWDFVLDKFELPIEIATIQEIKQLKPSRLQFKISNGLKKFFGKGLNFSKYSNKSFLKYEEFDLLPDDLYLEGEFLGFNYFENIKEFIQDKTSYVSGSSIQMEKYISLIKNSKKPIASIHFRRGDFITNQHAAKFHSTCSAEYYLNAIDHLENMVGNVDLLVFSDDIDWVKANIPFDNKSNIEYVTGLEDFEEFQLMSLCSHNIISNSGFSWFSSWLNRNKNKVIAPKSWVKDVDLNKKFIDAISESNLVFIEND